MILAWIGRVLGRESLNGDSGHPVGEAPNPMESAGNWHFGSNELAAELARTRRYEHALSIAVLSVAPLAGDEVREGTGLRPPVVRLPHVIFLLTAGVLRGMLRQSDIVCYQPAEEQFVIALAEAEAEQAGHAIHRVGSLFRTRFSLSVAAGVAAFPHDGLTLPDLVARAVERTRHAESSDNGTGSRGLRRADSAAEASRIG